MRRVSAMIFLLWGVGTIMAAGLNFTNGNIPTDKFGASLVAGGILLALARLLDRSNKKQTDDAEPNAGSGMESSALEDRRRE